MNKYVDRIIELAKIAANNDDIPVGAIVVQNGKIIGEGFNTRNAFKTITGHAEIAAIEMACKYVGDWRLDDCEMYVTLSPCMMCTGAILEARIKKVYYLCKRTNVYFNVEKYLPAMQIDDIKKSNKYAKMLQLFFENKRNK